MPAFRWLHLTDLHLGMKGQDHLWPNVRQAFYADLAKLHERTGPWDAVLFTGDFVQRGGDEEFARLDGWLDDLWKHLESLGSTPALLAVPGNHDLVRPAPKRAAARMLLKWPDNPDIHEEFWSDAESDYRELVAEVFGPFSEWRQRCPYRKGLAIQEGLLPGDFTATWEGDGLKVGVAGINTTFLQLAGGDFERRLACDVRQVQGACGGDLARWAAGHEVCLLLTHQPPSWLDKRSREGLHSEINPTVPATARFAVQLCGHLHEAIAHAESWGAGPLRRVWQGTSLFGLEHYGEERKESRSHGYAAGVIEGRASDLSLRYFPSLGSPSPSGWHFHPDHARFPHLQDDGGTLERLGAETPGTRRGAAKKARGSSPARKASAQKLRESALAAYLEAAWRFCDIVDLAGLPEGDRHLALQRFLLRQLYVPLRLQVEGTAEEAQDPHGFASLEERRESHRLAAAGREGAGSPELPGKPEPAGKRLAAARRLVVLGDPGAGKTTLLRWLATAYLMRRSKDPDLARLPEAGTLPDKDWLPILVRCRELDSGGLKSCTLDSLLRQSLGKAEMTEEQTGSVSRLLRDRLKAGRALLLVDGLDEVTDPTVRAAFCRQLEHIATSYHDSPMVVTSRIVGYRELRVRLRGFQHGTLADLTQEDKEAFVQRWCLATEPADRRGRTSEELLAALRSSDRIARLTGNPMMLTTLALVKRKVGKLPTRRAKLYEEAVQVLLNWRAEVDEPLEADEAVPQLEYLAHEMCRRGEQRLRRDEVLELLEAMRHEFAHIRPVARRSPEEILALLEARTGLLVQMGAVRHHNHLVPVYEFRHLTFQEYLAGLALVEGRFAGHDRSKSLAERIAPLAGQTEESRGSAEPEVREQWREALRLAVACANDDDVDAALLAILRPLPGEDLAVTARPRAILATLCLADEPNVSKAVANECVIGFARQIKEGDGIGSGRTAADRGALEVAGSEWAGLLSTALTREFLDRGPESREPQGGLAARVQAETAPTDRQTLSAWLAERARRLSESEERAAEAALACESWAWSMLKKSRSDSPERRAQEPPISLPEELVPGLLGRLAEGPALAHATSWALACLAGGLEEYREEAPWRPDNTELGLVLRRLTDPDLDRGAFYWLVRIAELHRPEAAAKPCLQRLSDPLWFVREASARLLGAAKDPRAVEPLIERLGDSDDRVRRVAARALGRIGDARAVAPLVQALGDTDSWFADAAATALKGLGAAALRQLLQALERPEVELRQRALQVLAEIRGDKGDAALVSRDLDGAHPWLDPMEPIPEPRVEEAARKLDLPEAEVRRRYEAMAREWGLRLEWTPEEPVGSAAS